MNTENNELNKKNTVAVKESLIQLTDKIYEQQIRIDALQAAIVSLSEKMNALERMVIVQKASSIGHGPSVK